MPDTILALTLFAGASLSVLMAAGQVVVRNKGLRNYLFTFFFLTLMAMQLIAFDFHFNSGDLFVWYTPLVFTTGPILYFVYQEITGEDYRIQLKDCFHMIPVVGAVFLEKLWPLQGLWFVAALCMNFFYIVAIVRATTFIWTIDLKPDERPVQLVMLSAVGVAVSLIVALLFFLDIRLLQTTIHPLLLSGIMFYSIIVGHRYPQLYQLTTKGRDREYKKTSLAGIDPDTIATKFAVAFTEDRLYEDDELTLRGLAAHLRLTPHQVSEYINLHLGSNFSSVVNGYRVTAAKELLVANPKSEVLTIAYQVGFGSKTSFNRAFTAFTGTSPTEFRKAQV